MRPADQVDGSFLLLTVLCVIEIAGAVLFMKRIGSNFLFGAIFVLAICLFAWTVSVLDQNVFGPRGSLSGADVGNDVKTGAVLLGLSVTLMGLSIGLDFYKLYYIIKGNEEKLKKTVI
jgi:hypothetical protein